MDLAELRVRYARQSAKALFKTKEQRRLQIYYKTAKLRKILLTSDIIKSEEERSLDKND